MGDSRPRTASGPFRVRPSRHRPAAPNGPPGTGPGHQEWKLPQQPPRPRRSSQTRGNRLPVPQPRGGGDRSIDLEFLRHSRQQDLDTTTASRPLIGHHPAPVVRIRSGGRGPFGRGEPARGGCPQRRGIVSFQLSQGCLSRRHPRWTGDRQREARPRNKFHHPGICTILRSADPRGVWARLRQNLASGRLRAHRR